jgi:hypothetical protein
METTRTNLTPSRVVAVASPHFAGLAAQIRRSFISLGWTGVFSCAADGRHSGRRKKVAVKPYYRRKSCRPLFPVAAGVFSCAEVAE